MRTFIRKKCKLTHIGTDKRFHIKFHEKNMDYDDFFKDNYLAKHNYFY